MVHFLLNFSSENTFVILETSSIPDPEIFLKTMQVFKEVIARSALCSSISPNFPINPSLPTTHLSILTSLYSHLHSTISRMEAIQQQTLSRLQQEFREIKTCMMSLSWKSFNTLSQAIPLIGHPCLKRKASSSHLKYSIKKQKTTLLPTSTTSTKSSTSSLRKSCCKSKVLSKFSDYYSKKTKITVTSSSVKKTLIKENLPPSSPIPPKSPIKLLSESIDNIVASDDEKQSTQETADQYPQTPNVKPLPAIKKEQSSITTSPLLCDDAAQAPTSPTPEKPSTSSLRRSSSKRKVSPKFSDYQTKRTLTILTSASPTETPIEKNCPPSSPVSPKSSIELFTEDTDGIAASDDEEYSTPSTSAILISEKKQSPIKDKELATSTKIQKIKTSIKESATLIEEAFLPIIQAPSLVNKHHFVTLTFITKDQSLTITYREKIASIYLFLNFLKQVEQNIHTCVHYKCARYIPEIPQQQSSNKFDLLKALYASIVRNHYFFVKNHGSLSTKIQQKVDFLLNLLNKKYYAALQKKRSDFLEEADNSSHHIDLKTFIEKPPQPILNEFNFAWYMLKKQSHSKSFWITHNLISFDQFQQLRSIFGNAKNVLKHIQKIRQETNLWIDCNDGSVKLPHFPKHPLTSHQGFQILQTIITYNKKCFNEHIALLEKEISDICWKKSPFYKKTVNTLDETDKCLREWKDSLKLQYSNTPLPKTADKITSISRETTQEINSPQPIQDTSFVQNDPIFIKIVPNTAFNSFTIRLCKRPMINNFKSSCKIAKNLLDSSSYICQKVISKDIPISSNNPLVITKTLFTVLCISAFGYRQKTASSKRMSALITPDAIQSLFDTLKTLDQTYCQISNHPYDPSPEIYHPDLQDIMIRGDILSLVAIQPSTYSFTYTFLSISFKNLHFSTLKRTYSHSHPRHLLQLIYDQLCHPFRDIIKLILFSEISTLTSTVSEPSFLELLHAEGITSSERFTRHETLILCRKMLEKLQTQVFTDALFKETSEICNNIKNNLNITLTWLNAHIAHQPLPTTPLPADLYSLPITVIQISKEIRHTYHISHPKLWFQKRNSQLDRFKTCAKMTYKWLSYLLNHSLQSKEKIIYQNQTFLDFLSLVPMIYRTVEYEMLQVKKMLLIALQSPLSYPSIQKSSKTGFQFLLKCQNLIKTKWQELHPDTPIPTLEDLPENIKPFLPFTSQDVELLKEDPIFSESGIKLMEILNYSDDSEIHSIPADSDQSQNIAPLSTIQQKPSSKTISLLFSDDATQTPTPPIPEKPSTVSSSVTQTLIKENLPPSSPIPPKSPIKLFSESIDNIVASDDEEQSTPETADQDPQTPNIEPLPAIKKEQSSITATLLLSDDATQDPISPTPEKPSTSSLHKSSRKRKVLSKSSDSETKRTKITTEENLPPLSLIPPRSLQKITTSTEASATHVKETFLPITQAPSSANEHYFVALTYNTKRKSLIITYREKINSVYVFLNFLKQVQHSIHVCVHYKCTRYIPEIPQQQSSNTLDLLQALYASVVRNHYFFAKNHASLSTKVQQQVDSLLNLLNQKYYATLQEEDSEFLKKPDDCSHHLALKTFTTTPPQTILSQFTFSWYILKKKAHSKSFWIIHTFFSFDQFQQLRSISNSAKTILNHIEEAKQETSLLIDCNDGSITLPYLPQSPITSHQGCQILQAIIAHNRQCFNEHITLLEKDIPDTCWKKRPHYKEIVKILNETDKCLHAWKDSLQLQYSNTPLPKPADKIPSISRETIQEINSPLPSQDTSFVQNNPIFITIIPNTSFNSFTIRFCQRPGIKNFKAFCKIAKNLIDSSSYLCQEIISKDIPISSKNPLVITKTLFTTLCISAFGYHQKTNSSKKMSALTPDLIHSLFDTLKALDQKYCQISDTPYDPSPEIYHPDLQAIITQGNILSLATIQPSTYSFSYTFISISFKKLSFSTLEKIYNHSHPRPLLQLIDNQLCYPLRNIIQLILSSEVSSLTGTFSEPSSLELLHAEGITSSKRFTRHETLILCRKMLEKLQTQILTDPLFKETSGVCSNIKNNLHITLTWLNAHIAHQPLPSVLLPSDLYSIPITVIQISIEPHHTYQISHLKLWFQEKSSQLNRFKTCSKTTYKWISYLFNHPPQSKEKIIYQDQTFLDFSSLVPVIYRTIEYEMLQVKKMLLIILQQSLSLPSIQKSSKIGFQFLLKCQSLIETKWKELYPNTPIPTLEDLSEDIKPLLPFTSQDVELLKEDPIFSESGINLMEIFKDIDDSDQEESLLSDDITPKTSSK